MKKAEDAKAYVCQECGLHYEDEQITKQCQEWCAKYKSCNLEITKHSIEAQAAGNKGRP
jgi:predicted Zn-ribbon and HTH transcriptional regulator